MATICPLCDDFLHASRTASKPASQPDGRMVGHYFDYFLTNIDFATKNLQVPRSKEKERKRGADVRTV